MTSVTDASACDAVDYQSLNACALESQEQERCTLASGVINKDNLKWVP